MPTPVPKPTTAGTGKVAVADVKLSFVNVRTGPDTEYDDIGDLRDHSLVVYYPDSATDNWVWIEQQGLGGWVSNSVVTFRSLNTWSGRAQTPYDGKVAIWHWKGQGVPERTIDQFAQNLKRRAPNVQMVWVKTSDATEWMGEYDSGNLAINGPQDVDRWVQGLAQYGLEFHAWCVLHGEDIATEAELIKAVCNRPGVKSMILDIEPYQGYWRAGREPIRPLMLNVRGGIPPQFHIGLGVDPREQHFKSIYPDAWFPFVNSVHAMAYWRTFDQDPREVFEEVYDIWGDYGRPIIPIMQGDADFIEQIEAHNIATKLFGAASLSWWRLGVISDWRAVDTKVEVIKVPEDIEPEKPPVYGYTDEIIVIPNGAGFRSGTYDAGTFGQFEGQWGWTVLYTTSKPRLASVWTEYKAQLPQSGEYEIAVFIPRRNATTTRARYKIHGVKGTNTEVVVDVNQNRHQNQWVPIGIFELDKNAENAGKVFLTDATGETDKFVAFDAVRWRRIVSFGTNPPAPPPGGVIDGVHVTNGYDAPIGTPEQRRGNQIWPSGWLDVSPFAVLYFVGTSQEAYHTGADLNWGKPYDDLGQPVYAVASGVVTFAASLPVWGNVVVVRHDPLYTVDGKVLYSRSSHVQNIQVEVGERVTRGQQIAEVGNGFGRYVPHLHFDLSPTTLFASKPDNWPGRDLAFLLKHYIDPKVFIQGNRPR